MIRTTLTLALFCASAAYGNYLTLEPEPTSQQAGFDPFAKGQRSLDLYGSYTRSTEGSDRQQFISGTVGYGYSPRDSLIVSAELSAATIDAKADLDDSGIGAGFSLRVRYRFLELGSASLFVDGSTGVFLADVDVPAVGTNFNFRSMIGLGLSVPLNEQLRLITGARLQHISNAHLDEDNDGYNGVEAYVGVTIPL